MLFVTNKPRCVFPQTETLRWRTSQEPPTEARCLYAQAAKSRNSNKQASGPPGPRLGAAPAPPNPTRAETLQLLRRVCCMFGWSDRCMEAEVEVQSQRAPGAYLLFC